MENNYETLELMVNEGNNGVVEEPTYEVVVDVEEEETVSVFNTVAAVTAGVGLAVGGFMWYKSRKKKRIEKEMIEFASRVFDDMVKLGHYEIEKKDDFVKMYLDGYDMIKINELLSVKKDINEKIEEVDE